MLLKIQYLLHSQEFYYIEFLLFFWLISVSKSGTKAPTSLTFDNNGTKMFVVGFNGDYINEFTLSAELCPTKLIKVQKKNDIYKRNCTRFGH